MIRAQRPSHQVWKLTADLVIFTIRTPDLLPGGSPTTARELCILLVTRGNDPYRGAWALPGGFVRQGESLGDAAVRELHEETGIRGGALPLEQVKTYSEPGRDPRGPIATCAFLAIAPDLADAEAGTDAASAAWVPVRRVLDGLDLAFDHAEIVRDALALARAKLRFTTIATSFCGPRFTIKQLREVYETVWGVKLDGPNFHRKVADDTGFIVPTGENEKTSGRPAALYRAGDAVMLDRPILPSTPL
ncbi:NUDIX domain-containing protein [Actinosynnema sp. NPDC047251]|uniref:NUDIX family hydrolase n=1 Tax=Saccharothrix espanaensis (strain ATCC 51144 / DSM 44229 / JCM 9112 / NBRC 15066 / NRRL 15764) TaxID=1179773 RepID=K0JV48_SACES|nr:NUDIX domain-containing protein [Saccharothrix espanaensis]CCH29387.1 NUDIX family hydrolase [Saccharothrix espanaensis DSM 44229]